MTRPLHGMEWKEEGEKREPNFNYELNSLLRNNFTESGKKGTEDKLQTVIAGVGAGRSG